MGVLGGETGETLDLDAEIARLQLDLAAILDPEE